MSDVTPTTKPYTKVGQAVYQAWWDETLQAMVRGWVVKARWRDTGEIITVRVPETADLASTADALIRYQGAQLDALSQLGA